MFNVAILIILVYQYQEYATVMQMPRMRRTRREPAKSRPFPPSSAGRFRLPSRRAQTRERLDFEGRHERLDLEGRRESAKARAMHHVRHKLHNTEFTCVL